MRRVCFFLWTSALLLVGAVVCPAQTWTKPASPPPPITGNRPQIGGVGIFPANNVWNTPVDTLPVQRPVHLVDDHGGHNFHPDFGTIYNGLLNGITVNVVPGNTTPAVRVNITDYASESDTLPGGDNTTRLLPIPANVVIEGDPNSSPTWTVEGDHHLLLIDSDTKILHELYGALREPDGSITAKQYSKWDLESNALRLDSWTSADAAGLPIAPGLIVYDQVEACLAVDPQGDSCTLGHALRFTLDLTHGPHIWPARHDANSGDIQHPPFGLRVRLKSDYDTSAYSPTNRVILNTLKKYGALLADNGGDWFFQGAPDPRWNDEDLHLLIQVVPGYYMEVVDTTNWRVDADSGEANPGGTGLPVDSWPKPNPILAIDFADPTAIDTAPGFTSFSMNSYDPAIGYGWQSMPGLGWRTRSISDAPWKNIVITETPSTQTFLVDLPNGSYSVTVFLGDPEFSNNKGLIVSAQGITQFTLASGTGHGQRLIKTFSVAITDGRLNLTFGPVEVGSLALAGLEIDPL